ncbi:MAG TPA: hypothetical protein VFW33_20235, partial [Gemmataceae bacterium]|nr:hypothetical protein [Gemmataceae bacterium]
VTGLAFSADGKRLIGAAGRTVRVWVADSGLPVLTLPGQADGIRGADSGVPVLTLPGQRDDLRGLSLGGGGTRLATAGGDRTVRVWSAAAPEYPLSASQGVRSRKPQAAGAVNLPARATPVTSSHASSAFPFPPSQRARAARPIHWTTFRPAGKSTQERRPTARGRARTARLSPPLPTETLMRSLSRWFLCLGLAATLACPAAFADDRLVPAGGPLHGGYGPPAVIAQPNCPPPLPGGVSPPYTMPGTSPGATAPGLSPGATAPGAGTGSAPGGLPSSPANAPNPFDSNAMDSRALAEAGGTSAPESAASTLLGDLAGGTYYTTVIATVFPSASGSARIATRLVRVPGINRGSFKITENESPRPLDRVFINYNYYNRIGTSAADGGAIRPDLHRETAGFEKTFFDGNASFGMRVPYLQTTDSDGFAGGSDIGDITFISKVAVYNNRQTGSVLSVGVAVTAPTGPDDILADGSRLHSTLIQPYLGFICSAGSFSLRGFSAVIVPTDGRDVTLITNDVAVDLALYQNCDAFISSIVPTVEFHLTDPTNHRGLSSSGDVGFPDILVLTTGAHIGLGKHAVLNVGGAIPLTGPKPFDFEGIAQLNWAF